MQNLADMLMEQIRLNFKQIIMWLFFSASGNFIYQVYKVKTIFALMSGCLICGIILALDLTLNFGPLNYAIIYIIIQLGPVVIGAFFGGGFGELMAIRLKSARNEAMMMITNRKK